MNHPEKARTFTADAARTAWHDQALWFIRQKRDRAVSQVPEWEELRARAAAIKAHAMSRLDHYLELFEARATANGAVVHWAADGPELCRIVQGLLAARGVQRVVKSKSMLTEECHLNPHLEAHGIEVVDTDLGERIVQLRHEPPSHIVMPAIHLKRAEIGDLFHEKMGTRAGADDPGYLAEAARADLRGRFLGAEAGITGVNFAVAELGAVVVCTNEGNADLGTALPRLHIACMGLEKIIPRAGDLGVFLRLLARSATGQPVTAYTSHFLRPRAGAEFHIVIVDNGRSAVLAQPEFRSTLSCIRCGACMNTCPVYRRSGGHSYGFVTPGPIGSVIAPGRDAREHRTLPFASSLCGSCSDVCPVRIELHTQLLAWRRVLASRGLVSPLKLWSMAVLAWVLRDPVRFERAGWIGRRLLSALPRFLIYNPLNAWGRQRELPAPPRESFRDLYRLRMPRGPKT